MGVAESPGFPWLGVDDHFSFPDPAGADAEGIVGVGGNLSPGMLLSAYRQGIFPFFGEGDPILWWCPDPRFVIFPDEIHVSRSMRRVLRRTDLNVSLDLDFAGVIHACATVPRAKHNAMWITPAMEAGYNRLHDLGFAHSCEVRRDGRLVGGVYGVSLGRIFFGESMFSTETNASKVALIRLARFLHSRGFALLDTQLKNPHVASMGGRGIPRHEFLSRLRDGLSVTTLSGSWSSLPV